MTLDTKAVRERAAEIIREHGLAQSHALSTWTLDTALIVAVHHVDPEIKNPDLLMEVLAELRAELGVHNLVKWSDAQSGPEPVIAALLRRGG